MRLRSSAAASIGTERDARFIADPVARDEVRVRKSNRLGIIGNRPDDVASLRAVRGRSAG